MRKFNVAIIGATGNVGREILTLLDERQFPTNVVHAVASADSIGKSVSFGEDTLKVKQITEIDFTDIDMAFFCAGSKVSRTYAKDAASKGCVVIDKSSLFRLSDDVPLIVPEANIASLAKIRNSEHGYIVANPNCVAIPLAVALKPLDNAAKIKRLVISTYQSVSGAGKEAMDELYTQTKAKYLFEDLAPRAFSRQIAFNLIPQIGEFNSEGKTDEEFKIEHELKKIMGNHIAATVTCVRVPVFVGHSISVNVEFATKLSAKEAEEILSEADGVITYGNQNNVKYATPIDSVGEDAVSVSRIRDDNSVLNAINMWIVSDNLRKGAALNAIQIAEFLIKK